MELSRNYLSPLKNRLLTVWGSNRGTNMGKMSFETLILLVSERLLQEFYHLVFIL